MAPPQRSLLETAVGLHQAGQLDEAERHYRLLLGGDPKNVHALHFLGVLNHQRGRQAEAIDLINKAIALNRRVPEFHYNLGAVLQAAGRLDDAAGHYSKAVSLKTAYTDAWFELGNVLARQGRLAEATEKYQRALAQRPVYPAALVNLGNVQLMQGKRREAVESWLGALKHTPNDVTARMNVALALKADGKLDEAVAQLRQVLATKPDFADAHYNLANTLVSRRDIAATADAAEAYKLARRLLTPQAPPEIKHSLTVYLRSHLFGPGSIDIRDDLITALTEPWCRPIELGATVTRYVKSDPAIAQALANFRARPRSATRAGVLDAATVSAIANNALLQAYLVSTAIADEELETLMSSLRADLILASSRDAIETGPLLSFYCALARQCFLNEYVYGQTPAESSAVDALCQEVEAALSARTTVSPASLIAIACYRPLHHLATASVLLELSWPPDVAELIRQQVSEPLEERELRKSIPALTPIADATSVKVREQYEENPYPRWARVAHNANPESVAEYLGKKFSRSTSGQIGLGGDVEVLVAGCGTGQHPIESAARFKDARILAIDLSLTSLSYAQRQANALGVKAVRFAQADITKLPETGMRFDIIECAGVLHHMADPYAGWRGLLTMLKPGGVMMIGLYSKMARREIHLAREFIAAQGYQSTADDIRRCRQAMFDLPDTSEVRLVTQLRDFYSLSDCRDLIFHVQEYNHTLPEISEFLAENKLEFLGFELEQPTYEHFVARFPDEAAKIDLALWHQFETENPSAFIGMYQFWIRKPAAQA